jgi:hypothetical protein
MATDGDDPVVILEMTQRNLLTGGEVDHADFLARADLLAAMGHDVLVSNFGHYHSLVTFLRRHTSRQIVFALGVPNLRDLFREEYYNDLPGGSLEAMGRLFNGDVKLTVYPFQAEGSPVAATVENLTIPASLENLYRHLLTGGRIVGIDGVSRDRLHMFAGTVRELLRQGDPRWEAMVPAPAASIIKKRKLFGYGRQPAEKVLLAQV